MGRRQAAEDVLDTDKITLEEGTEQQYARVIGPRGNSQHEVEFADGSRKLVTLPPRFRNTVWVKRGHYVIVDPSLGTTSDKVCGEIVRVLFPKHIKVLENDGEWPSEFSKKQGHVEDKEDDEEDDLFVNNNRPVMSDTEESSSDQDDEDDDDDDDEEKH
ncbi:hypothetical protein EC973_009565 [Apophysomyces ossiformis]|uniref:S1-like domain-containing protein n=1 Tax=Apophysomyces ossiformis TaxID=679940 RepID=A0A8H7BLS0_9FUNG|nr:hypothetical protein EC973_009565 [Apophysomyces ossiformis]